MLWYQLTCFENFAYCWFNTNITSLCLSIHEIEHYTQHLSICFDFFLLFLQWNSSFLCYDSSESCSWNALVRETDIWIRLLCVRFLAKTRSQNNRYRLWSFVVFSTVIHFYAVNPLTADVLYCISFSASYRQNHHKWLGCFWKRRKFAIKMVYIY